MRDAVESTTRLAQVQGHGGESGAIREATSSRRRSLEAVVAEAVDSLRDHEQGVEQPRRDEIRDVVERLSRHPDLLPAWLDATLRDLPEETFGFGELDTGDWTPPAPPQRPTRSSSERAAPARPTRAEEERRRAKLEQATAAVDEARAAVQLAREALDVADKEATSAERLLEQRRRARSHAETKLAQAQRDLDKAETRRRTAQAADP